MIDYKDSNAVLEVCEAATPGEWVTTPGNEFVVQDKYDKDDCRQGICKGLHKPKRTEDMDFITLAREALPYYVAEAERLRDVIKAAKHELTETIAAANFEGLEEKLQGHQYGDGSLSDLVTRWLLVGMDNAVKVLAELRDSGMNEKLLPCPFCGFPAELTGECDMVWARCTSCEAQRIYKFDEPEEAIADWNERHGLEG